MESLIIKGASNSGKSTTIRELCKILNPKEVFKLEINLNDYSKSKRLKAKVDDIFNNTFLINLNGKYILVCAGATTEQNIRITVLINVCVILNINLSFCIVAMRLFERRKDFNTPNELEKLSNVLEIYRIKRIEIESFEKSEEFQDRLNHLKNQILKSI